MIFTKDASEALGAAVNFGYNFGFIPFKYKTKESRFSLRTSKIKNIQYFFNTILQLLHGIYFLLQLYLELSVVHRKRKSLLDLDSNDIGDDYAQIYWLLLFFFIMIWASTHYLTKWTNRSELVEFINEISKLGNKGMSKLYILVIKN